jgi:hypothetical protein
LESLLRGDGVLALNAGRGALALIHPLWLRNPEERGPYLYILLCFASLAAVCGYVLVIVATPVWLRWIMGFEAVQLQGPHLYIMPGLALLLAPWLAWLGLWTACCRLWAFGGRLSELLGRPDQPPGRAGRFRQWAAAHPGQWGVLLVLPLVASAVLLPLLGLLAAASAEWSDLLHSWLDPITQILK